jgi:hypothetical protein
MGGDNSAARHGREIRRLCNRRPQPVADAAVEPRDSEAFKR